MIGIEYDCYERLLAMRADHGIVSCLHAIIGLSICQIRLYVRNFVTPRFIRPPSRGSSRRAKEAPCRVDLRCSIAFAHSDATTFDSSYVFDEEPRRGSGRYLREKTSATQLFFLLGNPHVAFSVLLVSNHNSVSEILTADSSAERTAFQRRPRGPPQPS